MDNGIMKSAMNKKKTSIETNKSKIHNQTID